MSFLEFDLDAAPSERLVELAHTCSHAGLWHCGVRGNKKLAAELGVTRGDLETLICIVWNLIAKLHCAKGEPGDSGRRIYELTVAAQYDDLPDELRWPGARSTETTT
jgi:hypothetical protein